MVAVGVPHHTTHRGNNRQDVFLSDEDRRRYQNLLQEQLQACGVSLLGWCWMTNHVHLIAVPRQPDSLVRLVGGTHARYAQEFNRRYRRSRRLWQSRFFSCALGADHLVDALAYVDRNPLRAGLVGEATAYQRSSAAAHETTKDESDLLDWAEFRSIRAIADWKGRLSLTIEAATLGRLRHATQCGAPFGSADFVKELEGRFKRNLKPAHRGRPPNQRLSALFSNRKMSLKEAGEGSCGQEGL